jgi:hypothetical protein
MKSAILAIGDIVDLPLLFRDVGNGVRSETIEGLLLKAPIVPVNVSGNTAKRTVNVSGNVAAISPEMRELVFGWRAEGASWAECARCLDERGILPPRGGRWPFENGGTNLGRYFA